MNLKSAARTLGVHYQTAYKLVRSGKLAAVRVGGGYEISEAAIERYLAEREAMARLPEIPPPAAAGAEADPLDAARAALEVPTPHARTVAELVAEGLVAALGDLVVVRPAPTPTGATLAGPVVRHRDARRRAIATVAAEADGLVDSCLTRRAVAEACTILMPHVAQDTLRAETRPETLQYLDDAGVHSLVAVPVEVDGTVVAVVVVTRDAPGRPYTREDAALVERFAAVIGAAHRRSRLAAQAQARRHTLMAEVADAVDRGAPPGALETLLHDGPVAELVCDAQARVVAVNTAAAALAGVTPERIVGRPLASLTAPDERPAQDEAVRRLLVGELTYLDARRTVRTPGGEVTVAAHHGVVRDPAAQPRALVVVAHRLA